MSSKRSALRYKCENETVLIRTAYDDGEAKLINVSTSGCAISSPSVQLALHDKVLLVFSAKNEESIQIQARIIRIDANEIGAEFTIIEPESADLLRSHFSLKQRERKRKHTQG